MVDLWGGLADRAANRPWRDNPVAQVASTTKGATAICAHLLAQRGELDLDALVLRYCEEPRVAEFEDAAPFTLEELIAGLTSATGLGTGTGTAWVQSTWSPTRSRGTPVGSAAPP